MYNNFSLTKVPTRTNKPRNTGLTMVMDKGLSVRDVEDLIEVSGDYIDIVKLGWATSYVTPNLLGKLEVYRAA